MLKYWSIKKYGTKFLPILEKRYGKHPYYSAHQIRATVYQKGFNPEFLPLAYILFLAQSEQEQVFLKEFPHLNIKTYKKDILMYLESKQYKGYLYQLK